MALAVRDLGDVCLGAKILIFKQITTKVYCFNYIAKMYA